MTRRGLLSVLALTTLLSASTARLPAGEPLPGTQPLTVTQPLDEFMISGIDTFALRELSASIARRAELWKRDFASREAYEASVAPNRARFRTIIGAVDPRVESPRFELVSTTQFDGIAQKATGYTVRYVRWQVLDGITAEGLLLQPAAAPRASVIALPDADWTPEQFAGLGSNPSPAAALVRELVLNGCQVVIPTLINREATYSGSPYVAYTNQAHREFIYRQSFELGRHVIGYEVQKVLAAVDAFSAEGARLPVGVVGVGEGGLLALYSAAADARIESALVCGYFQRREGVWSEPIYRNVWALLTEFGDAELAGLVAPRTLVVEACAVPEVAGPPAQVEGRRAGAAPGKIEVCTVASVRAEYDRAKPVYEQLKAAERFKLVTSREGDGPAGSELALKSFAQGLKLEFKAGGAKPEAEPQAVDVSAAGAIFDPQARQHRQFDEMVAFNQVLLRRSAKVRDRLWSKADRTSLDSWTTTAAAYRDRVYAELIGRLPDPKMDPNVRTRQVLDEPGYRGYEVVIDVYPDVVASGILLLPKDLQADEKRPVVVCQHGLEGVPMDTITREGQGFAYYSAFAHELANRGFITYAPQNPYRGRDKFRTLQRKSNPLQRSLFSYIIPQHQRTLEWLSTLPNVDPKRIAFYGLSYGGKTAVRVPPMLTQYCLSICSADYNEWVVKNASTEDPYSYMFTGEYEIFEWNMGHVANYAELANLMTPRPFMVERGHGDGVAPDEWVAWEYAKVRRHYTLLGIPEQTEIEFFNGPHKIHGVATYDFLHRHLNWPKRPAANSPASGKN